MNESIKKIAYGREYAMARQEWDESLKSLKLPESETDRRYYRMKELKERGSDRLTYILAGGAVTLAVAYIVYASLVAK